MCIRVYPRGCAAAAAGVARGRGWSCVDVTSQMVGVPEDDVKWTTVREVLSCYEAHGVALPAGVRIGVNLATTFA